MTKSQLTPYCGSSECNKQYHREKGNIVKGSFSMIEKSLDRTNANTCLDCGSFVFWVRGDKLNPTKFCRPKELSK